MVVRYDGSNRAAVLDEVAFRRNDWHSGRRPQTEVMVLGEGASRVDARNRLAAAVQSLLAGIAVDERISKVALGNALDGPVTTTGDRHPLSRPHVHSLPSPDSAAIRVMALSFSV